ncbi:hypothetical protein FF38_14142 [Lucilia cuprina]|uniref:Uncharacterized protein n=1 Tax=Lucilia cuprina TaxID=7375 RepID=A0A0L0C1D2_LUCCU|nr:hypothetical protein FF38_14142 [Lucilia cuprina]
MTHTRKMYVRHPDTYLPPLSNLSETEGESSSNDKCTKTNDDLEHSKRKLSANILRAPLFDHCKIDSKQVRVTDLLLVNEGKC